MSRRITIQLQVFGAVVHAQVGRRYDSLPKHAQSRLGGSDYAGRRLHYRKDNLDTIVIHVVRRDPGLIAHEAVHAANFILDSIQACPDFRNDEVQAYLVEHITREIWRRSA